MTVQFKRGDTVLYRGQTVQIVSTNDANMTITIIYNGKKITVDKNDLFGINNTTDDYMQNCISNSEDRIEHYKKKIEENKSLWSFAEAKLTDCQHEIHSFLAKKEVATASDLSNPYDLKEYEKLVTDKVSTKKLLNSAFFGIQSYANMALSEILNKGRYEEQQIINRNFA